ncbi:helix-turn-helix domain-containing protein [Actinomadura yumaensis]|uniref:helix-turn-helix domain-containing protein n=1 Tax=Actinomadura yumaensis TaxID=111807 RepID=UPI00360E1753
MGSEDSFPSPRCPQDVSDFKNDLRRLKAWSGFSYRELERRVQAAGDVLPAATIADMLNPARPRLPREGQVRSFARACGGTEEDLEPWVLARRRIAMSDAAPSLAGKRPTGMARALLARRPRPPVVPARRPIRRPFLRAAEPPISADRPLLTVWPRSPDAARWAPR